MQKETHAKATKQATESVLSKRSSFTNVVYSISKILLWICYPVFFSSTLIFVFETVSLITRGTSNEGVDFFLIYGVVFITTALLFTVVRSVNREISYHYAPIIQRLFQEALHERIQYQEFYRSPEWRILRQNFLRRRTRIEGRYICDFCKNPIGHDGDITVDHIKPRSKFPDLAMNIDNLLLACRRCNSSKGSKLLSDEEFPSLLAKSKELNG